MDQGSHQLDSGDAGISKPSLSFWEMMPAQLGRGDWYSRVQPFVGRLLAKYLEDQHKSFDPHGSELQWRRLAPEGIDELQGPTLIEILPTATLILEKLHQNRMLNELRASRSNSLLIVSLSELSSKEQNSIKKGLKEPLGGIPVIIWEKDKVLELLLKYAEFVGDEVPGLRGVAVDNIVEKSLESKPDDWKQTRDQHVAQLKKEYRENGLVLVLGAGVSLSTMRIPSWNNLLSRLFVAMIDSKFPADLSVRPEEMEYLVETLHSVHNAFPLIEAHYIRAGLEESFGEAVAKALYTDIVSEGEATSALLDALAQLCMPRRKGPNIRAVVTYNFDDLLEKHLERINVEFRSIYRDVDIAKDEELGIYHVHGFLPREAEQYEGLSESLLVFSEEGYHSLIKDPYSWSNITQLNFFRENTCVLVGLSLTDPNLRRLLDIAARKGDNPRHYAFLRREWTSTDQIRPEVMQAFMKVHYGIQENAFRQLGINIIWFEEHEDIPVILNSLRAR